MTRYLLGRVLSLVASLLAASIIIFLILEVVPGDPAQFMLGLNANPETLANLREQMGLDQPAVVRYFGWIAGMQQGDHGLS
jgi:peptide/nickel transport system permease protein